MSRYATKWESCTAAEYHSVSKDTLSVYSSYTNPDGEDGISSQPQILTTWGDDEKELLRSHGYRDKEDAKAGKWAWDYKYWKAIEWGEDE